MIKEKIQKLIDNKYFALIVTFIINVFFFIVCNNLFELKYEQVDDFMIMNLISKMDGNYSIYGIHMHPIICGIIILLYQTAININWYTIFLLAMQFISFTIIGTVFINRNKKIGIPLYISFIFIIYSKMLIYIQYTTVSMLSITAGLILLMCAIEDMKSIKKSSLIIAIVMILMGIMIRFSTIIITLPFMITYSIYKVLKDKNLKFIKILFILIISILLIYSSYNIIYNINPIYKDFLKFNDLRTYFHDYNWLYYYGNEEIFNNVNWSENDRDMLYAYCFCDEAFYNTEMLKRLKSSIENSRNYSEDTLKKCIDTFDEYIKEIKDDNYEKAFLIVKILVTYIYIYIIMNKSKEKEEKRNDLIKICFVGVLFWEIIGIHYLFIYINRPMFRVVISGYIIGIAMLMYLALERDKINNKKILKTIFTILVLIISIFEFKQNIYYASFYKKEDYSVYKEIIEYTSLHKENAYLYTLVMHDRFLAYSVYEKIPDDSFTNLRPLGDWDTYTQNYYDFKEKYNIENLISSLYRNDNVYLISGNVIWGEQYGEYIDIIIKYIKEHYNVEVEAIVEKEFYNDIKIYKLKNVD